MKFKKSRNKKHPDRYRCMKGCFGIGRAVRNWRDTKRRFLSKSLPQAVSTQQRSIPQKRMQGSRTHG
jgi:uncharacterized protein (DUF736 family)